MGSVMTGQMGYLKEKGDRFCARIAAPRTADSSRQTWTGDAPLAV